MSSFSIQSTHTSPFDFRKHRMLSRILQHCRHYHCPNHLHYFLSWSLVTLPEKSFHDHLAALSTMFSSHRLWTSQYSALFLSLNLHMQILMRPSNCTCPLLNCLIQKSMLYILTHLHTLQVPTSKEQKRDVHPHRLYFQTPDQRRLVFITVRCECMQTGTQTDWHLHLPRCNVLRNL